MTAVHPSLTRTEGTGPLDAARVAAQSGSPQVLEDPMAATYLINHLVDAKEVADIVTFLCSPRSRAINGDVVAVGGGVLCSIH